MKSIFDEIEEINEQNIWPSFTDVMMVVLMIFILTMVVTITHNTNLFRQLLATKTEISQKEKYLKELEKIKKELNEKINNLEIKLSTAQMKILMLSDENKKLKANLEGKIILIGDLSNKIKELSKQEENLKKILEEKEKLISEKETLIIDLRTEKEKLKDKLQQLELAKTELQQKYAELEDKYLKLVGPARSPKGKVIFKVKYFKPSLRSKPVYLIMPVNGKKFKKVSYNQLLKSLEKAKNKYGKKLYVQIIIPSNSNLTFDEAYKFTRFILHKYDYYYQK